MIIRKKKSNRQNFLQNRKIGRFGLVRMFWNNSRWQQLTDGLIITRFTNYIRFEKKAILVRGYLVRNRLFDEIDGVAFYVPDSKLQMAAPYRVSEFMVPFLKILKKRR